MPFPHILLLACLVSLATAQTASSSTTPTSTNAPVMLPAEVNDCHTHAADEVFCFNGSDEWAITSENAVQYDGTAALDECAPSGEDGDVIECKAPDESTVTLALEGGEEEHTHDEEDHDHDDSSTVAAESSSSTSAAAAAAATQGGVAVHAYGVSLGAGVLGLGAALLAL